MSDRTIDRKAIDRAVTRSFGIMRAKERDARIKGASDMTVEYLSGLDYGVRLMETFLLEALYEEAESGDSGGTDTGSREALGAGA